MSVSLKLEVSPQQSTRRTRADELQRQVVKMFRRLRVAVIYAGDKSTQGAVLYPTSSPRCWKSYETVANDIGEALTRLGCREVALIPEDMRLGERLKQAGSHLAWLNTGGVQGHSSVAHAPAMLEMLGVPYVGHDPLAAAMLDNKHVFKRQLVGAALPTAPFAVWHPAVNLAPIADPVFKNAFRGWQGNYVVKPVSGRASLHVNFVERAEELHETAREVADITGNHVLIEGYLPGKEYCIAVCGPVVAQDGRIVRLDGPFVFAGLERVLGKEEKIFTSMDVKPITSKRARALDPATDRHILARLEALARDVYRRLGLETLVRLDVRADADGNLFVLEANPKPDLKAPGPDATSLICLGLQAHRMSYDDLILSLLADRIDFLFAQRRGSADRLLALI
jgi:D-alanine-D-alanine ligase